MSATGSQPLTYQWFRNGAAVSNGTNTSGVTSATLTMVDIQTANAGIYYVVVSSSCGSQTSTPFSLTVNPPTHPDYNALADLFYSTNGMGWVNRTGWLRSCDPCGGWFGVECTGGRATRLGLLFNNMTGSIPETIAQLTSLTLLAIPYNPISGTLPVSLSGLSELATLWIQNAQLTGTIPEGYDRLRKLQVLNLSGNRLSGGIPTGLLSITGLTQFWLAGNQLSGDIPTSWSALTNVSSINLTSNPFTPGPIPIELSRLPKLANLFLADANRTGYIPATFGTITTLTHLSINDNQLSGCLPSSLTALCGRNIAISRNPGLPNNGDWAAFCANGTGSYNGTLTTTKTGYWHDKTVWSCGAMPQAGDRAVVQHPVTVAPVQLNQAGQVRLEGAGKLIYETGGLLKMGN